jgi:hypothetical protein
MIESLSPLAGLSRSYTQAAPALPPGTAARVKDEFLTIFYKELLKQSFKAPALGVPGEEEEQNDFMSTFRSDILIEQMAQELVKSGQLRPDWFDGANR